MLLRLVLMAIGLDPSLPERLEGGSWAVEFFHGRNAYQLRTKPIQEQVPDDYTAEQVFQAYGYNWNSTQRTLEAAGGGAIHIWVNNESQAEWQPVTKVQL